MDPHACGFAAALPPKGEQRAPWVGPAALVLDPHACGFAAALPPKGEQLAPWVGPAALVSSLETPYG